MSFAKYTVLQAGWDAAIFHDVNEAISYARELVPVTGVGESDAGQAPEPMTATVREYDSNALVASVTNRRIMGVFTKQVWGGRKGDDAITVGTEDFDATDDVLALSLEQLLALEDNDASTDGIGLEHVDWDGPFAVELVGPICKFFGVTRLDEITQQALEFMRREFRQEPEVSVTLELTVKVLVKKPASASTKDFINDLGYRLVSNTPGVQVMGSEVTGAQILVTAVDKPAPVI